MNKLRASLQALIDLYRMPTADEIAKRQLAEAEREILGHRDLAEYHDAMVMYLETKIERLRCRESSDTGLATGQEPINLNSPDLRSLAGARIKVA